MYIVKVIASTIILMATEAYSWFYLIDYDEASHPSALMGGGIAWFACAFGALKHGRNHSRVFAPKRRERYKRLRT